jgi:hypothetical protein
LIYRLKADTSCRHQGTRRAGLYTFATSNTGTLPHRVSKIEHNFSTDTPISEPDDIVGLFFAARPDAPSALDASGQINGNGRVRGVSGRLLAIAKSAFCYL